MALQKAAREMGEFSRYPQRPGQSGQVAHGVHVFPFFGHGQGQAAVTKAKRVVEHQHGDVVSSALGHHVHARDAKIHAAVAHADHDVAGTLKEHGQSR